MLCPFRFYGFDVVTVHSQALNVPDVTERGEVKPLCTAWHIAEDVISNGEVKVSMTDRHDEYAYRSVVLVREDASETRMIQSRPSYLLHAFHIHPVTVGVGCGGYHILAKDFTDNGIVRIYTGIFPV